jgi:hypothetical protein
MSDIESAASTGAGVGKGWSIISLWGGVGGSRTRNAKVTRWGTASIFWVRDGMEQGGSGLQDLFSNCPSQADSEPGMLS